MAAISNIEGIGRTIYLLRKSQRLTQAQLADKAGVSRNYISTIERDEANVTIEVLLDVAYALGYKVVIRFIQLTEEEKATTFTFGEK